MNCLHYFVHAINILSDREISLFSIETLIFIRPRMRQTSDITWEKKERERIRKRERKREKTNIAVLLYSTKNFFLSSPNTLRVFLYERLLNFYFKRIVRISNIVKEKKETSRIREGERNLILFHYSTQLKNIIFSARVTWDCLFFILRKKKTINIVYREKKNRKKSEDSTILFN